MWDSNLTTSRYALLNKHQNSYKSKFTKPSCLVMNDYPKLTVHLYNGTIIYIEWMCYFFQFELAPEVPSIYPGKIFV